MVDEADFGTLENVFNDSVAHLRQSAITDEIKQLSARAKDLTGEERQRLAELLAKKRQGPPSTAGTPI